MYSVAKVDGTGARTRDQKYKLYGPGPARRRLGADLLPDPAAELMAATRSHERRKQVEAVVLYPLDWLEERSGLVGAVKYFLFRKVPGDVNWFHTLGSATLTAFLVQAITGVVLAMYYKPDPERGVRVDQAHHERRHARLARPRHAPLGRERLHHPACSSTWRACSCSAPTSTRAS